MSEGDYLEAMVLGVVQGIAEFLPISSSGHLVILGELIHEASGRARPQGANQQLVIALHVGTLLSILLVYRGILWDVLRRRRIVVGVIVATLPLVAVALTPLPKLLEEAFATPAVVGVCLLLTAALLLAGQSLERGERPLEDIPWWHALAIGLFQMVALLPGVSRSGSTIAGGLVMGYRRTAAADFSFFIAVPAIAGAMVLEIAKAVRGESVGSAGGGFEPGALAAGALVSFVVGWITLRWLLGVIARGRLHWFAVYCACVGVATLIWQAVS
jgi:undecaprenyl-diphosphatase